MVNVRLNYESECTSLQSNDKVLWSQDTLYFRKKNSSSDKSANQMEECQEFHKI